MDRNNLTYLQQKKEACFNTTYILLTLGNPRDFKHGNSCALGYRLPFSIFAIKLFSKISVTICLKIQNPFSVEVNVG